MVATSSFLLSLKQQSGSAAENSPSLPAINSPCPSPRGRSLTFMESLVEIPNRDSPILRITGVLDEPAGAQGGVKTTPLSELAMKSQRRVERGG